MKIRRIRLQIKQVLTQVAILGLKHFLKEKQNKSLIFKNVTGMLSPELPVGQIKMIDPQIHRVRQEKLHHK
jgi:hypothetical protein